MPTATLYRMVTDQHVCPYGLKAKALLTHQGYDVDDQWLTNPDATDAFKAQHQVKTTPQTFIDGARIGGYDDLRRYFGKAVADPKATSYTPVIALFGMTALMALAASDAVYGTPFTTRAAVWFVAFSMVVLALLKLQNIETFSTMFLNYDLLARRWVRYAYLYPFAEALAGVLMIAGVFGWLSIPVALFIGSLGAVSVFRAVYIEKRTLKCACVGGGSNVPLGFVSLVENVMMIVVALWMLSAAVGTGSASQAYMTGMQRMDRGMDMPMSGDADWDFAAMMIPHHQGAIDMARVELQYGRDPLLRGMAKGIVDAQAKEIGELRAWLAKD